MNSHNQPPQAEDSPEDQLDADLHTLFAVGKQVLGSARLSDRLAFRLELLVRGIAGCRYCSRMLGDKHAPGCSFDGEVSSYDLPPIAPQASPGDDSAPF